MAPSLFRKLFMPQIDRNTINGFSKRVLKNMRFMAYQRKTQNEDVHLVTHLVLSLLGLIIYPYEHYKDTPALNFKTVTLSALEADGWCRWTFDPRYQQPKTLRQLLRRLRNAFAHRRIDFSSDSRRLEEVDIKLWDQNKHDIVEWRTTINAAALQDFAIRLSRLIDHRINRPVSC